MKPQSTIYWIFLSILFFTSSCSPEKHREKIRWDEFYTRLLFIESAAFTLYGSKPMTELILDHRSKEEKEALRQKWLANMSKKERSSKESGTAIPWNPQYDFEETWRLWEAHLDTAKMNQFIIVHVSRKASTFDFVYLVNIMELSTVIKKHYSLFERYVGFDFDPLEVVFDIQNANSLFWNKIFNGKASDPERICLIGILFGYGLENSYPFSLVFNAERMGSSKKFTSHLHKKLTESMKPEKLKGFSATSFLIPGFRTFSIDDPIKTKYEKEKTEIIKYYRGKDLGKATLELLYQ